MGLSVGIKNSVTLGDLERHNGRHFMVFHRIGLSKPSATNSPEISSILPASATKIF